MGRKGYPGEFRRKVLDLVESGKKIKDIARDLDVSEQTIYGWRAQERIDKGLAAGLTSAEHVELQKARARIKELETEVAIHRRAAELLKGEARPKGDSRRSK